jgi:hypothetical protein
MTGPSAGDPGMRPLAGWSAAGGTQENAEKSGKTSETSLLESAPTAWCGVGRACRGRWLADL